MTVLFGLLIPLAGTVFGSAAVFLMKNGLNKKTESVLLGSAAGVMTAASVWSLLLPSIEMSGQGALSFIPAAAGFLVGISFLLLLDRVTPLLEKRSKRMKNREDHKLRKISIMIFAVTLHNIPEGMAVGVALAAFIRNDSCVTAASCAALALGIAIQNFPEGAIISMPLKSRGISNSKSFLAGALSGAVEPAAGVLTLILTSMVAGALPYILSFAAGAMVFVVIKELIPESMTDNNSVFAVTGFALGFALMMSLDVALS